MSQRKNLQATCIVENLHMVIKFSMASILEYLKHTMGQSACWEEWAANTAQFIYSLRSAEN